MPRTVGRHTGVKARVLLMITERPCVSFSVTLFFALVIGGLGLALGGMSIDTAGWETRGTKIADRQISFNVWNTGAFTLDEGTPLAKGQAETNRRRARSLLMSPAEDFSDYAAHYFLKRVRKSLSRDSFMTPRDFVSPKKDAFTPTPKRSSRMLLQDSYKTCADAYWPLCLDGGSDCDGTEQNEHNAFHYSWREQSLMAIFSGSSDLLTTSSLYEMCRVEDKVMQLSGYTDNCVVSPGLCTGDAPSDSGLASSYVTVSNDLGTSTRCFPPRSLNRALMANLTVASCVEWTLTAGLQAELETVRTVLTQCADQWRTEPDEVDAECSQVGFSSAYLNAGFGTASPLLTTTLVEFPMEGGTVNDWLVEQETSGNIESALKSGKFKSSYDSNDGMLKETIADTALYSDMVLASAAVLIVLVLIWLHTGSVLLTLGGMLQVLLAFPSAVFLTTTVFQIKFFPFLNFIGLFVLIGVGADDCFVFFDKWVSAAAKLPKNATATEVAAQSYWEAVWAMFLTSVTTTAAFLASSITPIAPIRVFSIFMASLIVFDYIYNITIFAACVAFQHELQRNSNGKPHCCFDIFAWVKDKRQTCRVEEQLKYADLDPCPHGKLYRKCAECGPGHKRDKKHNRDQDVEGEHSVTNESGSPPERFCREKLYPVLHKFRWPFLVITLACGAAALWGASKLETPKNNDVLLLGEDHPMEQYGVIKKNGFMDSSDAVLWVNLNFGLVPYDEPVVNHLNPKSLPDLKLDSSFDPSSTEAQQWLVDFCTDTNLLMSDNSNCFPFYFKEWVQNQYERQVSCAANNPAQAIMDCDNKAPYLDQFTDACGQAGFPVAATTSIQCMRHYAQIKAQQNDDSSESPLRMFYQPTETSSDDDVKLFFMQLSFASNISWTSPVDELRADYDKWDAYMTSKLSSAPAGLKSGFHGGEAWHWMDTVEQMQLGAYTAAGVTLLLCGFVVLLGTGNVVITFYSLLAISAILGAVTATVVAMGWTLGFLEGICFSILIGLSVDFVIHLGVAYNEVSEEGMRRKEMDGNERNNSRHESTQEAVASLGFPIISAAFTTLVSAVILFFAQITFFNKFGLIVMLSMLFSLTATFLMYVPMLDAVGPQGSFGSVAACRRAVFGR